MIGREAAVEVARGRAGVELDEGEVAVHEHRVENPHELGLGTSDGVMGGGRRT